MYCSVVSRSRKSHPGPLPKLDVCGGYYYDELWSWNMYIILALALLIRVSMDLCFKGSVNALNFNTMESVFPNIAKLLKTPLFWISVSLALTNFWLWCMVLSFFDLSYAYPLFSLSYVLIMIASKYCFNEHLDKHKVMGIALIAVSSILLLVTPS
ncbi:hypothetical protein DID77_03760 [Candidatus Marinamargulisbacteria bacterium SCGC AG-439-L15]|nr:hypothetical protein DID77_03760 [Candidatus Marinamargulisbacteria bacterium SCGC AG-439-L15]